MCNQNCKQGRSCACRVNDGLSSIDYFAIAVIFIYVVFLVILMALEII